MLVAMKEKTATYRELYPHALGYDEDLDQEIHLKKLQVVWVDGSAGAHDSMHKCKLNAVPILNSTKRNIDLSKGGFYAHNVHMAPSNDGLIVHPPANIEGIQCKSSDNITRGIPPSTKGNGILKLGNKEDEYKGQNKKKTIWAEFNKVTEDTHNKFYSSLGDESKFNLFVVSNKYLKNYEEIKDAMDQGDEDDDDGDEDDDGDVIDGLPKGVALICHQNFKDYAGPFAHRGLYLPIEDD